MSHLIEEKSDWRVELVDAQAQRPRRRVAIRAFNPAAACAIAQSKNAGWIAHTAKPVSRKARHA